MPLVTFGHFIGLDIGIGLGIAVGVGRCKHTINTIRLCIL